MPAIVRALPFPDICGRTEGFQDRDRQHFRLVSARGKVIT